MMLKVLRHDGRPETAPHYDLFEIDPEPGMTVLGALFRVREVYDDSLAFRYSCRGAVCGSCAMLVNRYPALACRTQVAGLLAGEEREPLAPYPAIEGGEAWDAGTTVLVEPLPHLPVLRDLVVDMAPFFAHYRAMRPTFAPADRAPERERSMAPETAGALEVYTACLLCGACYGACPVDGDDPAYAGPAALAKVYRFHLDPREAGNGRRLRTADTPDGWWRCEFHANCRRVCPRGIEPNVAIGRARAELTRRKKGGE
ncbi:succinate dehydrogenase/fumarate reductase iron-sulfur subunit [Methanofollis aquaemaris]|uniref:succinate dehydrogenase n=1 Tax=Methanofollis aquaemaris TaxID=126734 RepID=A0A8A3S420_9EURY|nr:succinate dehydrogenase/fumarate reductase iron-sulfur subunit [Methanofollis aquaemaris]QSZ66410.1 succinate dehydrogenase/fumarate reductase iron-sulfur subunit [Methanofollis aquaemaris]